MDRGAEARKMGYNYGGIAHLTAKGAAGRTGHLLPREAIWTCAAVFRVLPGGA